MGIDLRYSPFKRLTCNIGLHYNSLREFELLDNDEETVRTLESADSFGGIISFLVNMSISGEGGDVREHKRCDVVTVIVLSIQLFSSAW